MTNNPELIEQIKKQLRRISKEELIEIVNEIEIENIKEDFEKTLTIIPDLEIDDLPLLKQAFNTLIQCPTLVSNIIQITSITESDNCIVINI